VSVALFTVPIVAVTAFISNTKNANSFYVAAVVKPSCVFFFPAFSGRCGTSPRAVWRLPWALAPRACNDLQPYTINFLRSPAPGRWPPWDHQRGSGSRRLDGAGEGLRAGLAYSRSALAVLNDDLFSMSWHTSRLLFLASPLAYGFVLACLARCVTAPRAVWWLPVALGPSSPTTFYPCELRCPSPDSLYVFRRELEVLSEATPSIRRRASQARKLRGSPPPAPKPRRDAASPKHLPLFELRPLWYHPGLEETPERNE
jgi:hypothetical protein